MANNREYLITKLSFREERDLIQNVFAYEYDGQTLSEGSNQQRHWIVNKINDGSQISIMIRNEKGAWLRDKPFVYQNGLFTWGKVLPENITKRKTFVSYYHQADQSYRERFENLFGDLLVSKCVNDGDIDSDNSHEYIKQLIQKEYLADTTVLIVLIGTKTKCRMHVDWEISGALNLKVGDKNAGLLGILLPTHPDYGSGKATYDLMPQRLADNFKSGYAIIRDWTDDRIKMQSYIEEAFNNRNLKEDKRINSRPQMDRNTCD